MARPDPHSVTDDTQPATRHLELDAHVDFETKRLTCTRLAVFGHLLPSHPPGD